MSHNSLCNLLQTVRQMATNASFSLKHSLSDLVKLLRHLLNGERGQINCTDDIGKEQTFEVLSKLWSVCIVYIRSGTLTG